MENMGYRFRQRSNSEMYELVNTVRCGSHLGKKSMGKMHGVEQIKCLDLSVMYRVWTSE